MGDPNIRYADGTEISPQLDLRFSLGLYMGIRPVRSIPGVPSPLADPRAANIDFVLVRESIEGLFASYGKGIITADKEARETLVITRKNSEKLFESTFKLAKQRQQCGRGIGRVICVDKANVFTAFAFFRKIFYQVATQYDLTADHAYVDATALNLITHPWDFDVKVTENMFGDVRSDQGAALIGGMGYAPSADIGDDHAVFQPCHGRAPDIAGKRLANPTAMILSAAMMLEWLADKYQVMGARQAAELIVGAVDAAFASGDLCTYELGGSAGLDDVTQAVSNVLATLSITS